MDVRSHAKNPGSSHDPDTASQEITAAMTLCMLANYLGRRDAILTGGRSAYALDRCGLVLSAGLASANTTARTCCATRTC